MDLRTGRSAIRQSAASKALQLAAAFRRAHEPDAPSASDAVQAQAVVVLDAVLEGRLDAEAGDPDDAVIRERGRELVRIAHYWWCAVHPRVKRRWSAWSAHGIVWEYERGGEHHVRCAYCDRDLNTLGRGTHTLTDEFLRKLERHAIPCALQGLLRVDYWDEARATARARR